MTVANNVMSAMPVQSQGNFLQLHASDGKP